MKKLLLSILISLVLVSCAPCETVHSEVTVYYINGDKETLNYINVEANDLSLSVEGSLQYWRGTVFVKTLATNVRRYEYRITYVEKIK